MQTVRRIPFVRGAGQIRRVGGVTARGRAALKLTGPVENMKDGGEIAVIPAVIRRTGDRWTTRGQTFATAFDAVVFALAAVSDEGFDRWT